MSALMKPADAHMSDAEWQTRCDLAALYRIVQHFGWTDIINTHMSARVPGEPGAFLINRYGDMFDEITASRLVKMDLDGNVLGEPGPYNQAGFTIHSGVYRAQPDAFCVTHTHTRAGVAASLFRDGFRPISQDALYILDDITYHDYGVPTSQEECEALGVACRKGSAVVLLNHGLLTWGLTIPSAFKQLYYMERASEIEVMARSMGGKPEVIADHVIAAAERRMKKLRASPDYGVAEFEGLQRTLERKGARWRC